MIRRILFDVTDTIHRPYNTGIQRVVRGILRHLPEVAGAGSIEVVPVVVRGTEISPVTLTEALEGRPAALPAARTPWWGRFVPGRSRWPGTTVLPTVTPRRGDLFLSLDAAWVLPLAQLLPRLREAGAYSGILVHDLIPLRYPEFTIPAHTEIFERFVHTILAEADFLLTNSEATRADVLDFAAEHPAAADVAALAARTEAVKLGSEVFDRPDGVVTPAVASLFDAPGRSTYITVGSFEPKKNQHFAFRAFRELCARRPDVQLVMIGRSGWSYEHVLREIQAHPLFGRQIHVVHDATDTDLAYAYRRARALIFPSITEGFGIPVVEALQQKTPVLCSDIPIFREIGGEVCRYFPLHDPGPLADLIDAIEAGSLALPTLTDHRVTTWRESTEQVVSAARRLATPGTAPARAGGTAGGPPATLVRA